MNKLGSFLKEKRLDQAKTQLEIAKELEMTRTNYVCLERGNRTPKLYTIRKIARLYNIEIKEIYKMLGE